MYNITTEQILKTKAPKQAAVFKTVMILACILAVTTIPSTYALGILLTAVLVVFTVILFKYYNAEYEYSLVDGELTIDKIMSQSMRKRCGVYNIAKASMLAKPTCQAALGMEHKKLRTAEYTSNTAPEKTVVLYTMDASNEMVRIILEPDEKMLEALRRVYRKPQTAWMNKKSECTEKKCLTLSAYFVILSNNTQNTLK